MTNEKWNGLVIKYKEDEFLRIGYYKNDQRHGLFTYFKIQENEMTGKVFWEDKEISSFDIPFD